MYGTVAKFKVKPGSFEAFKSSIDERKPDGFVATYVFQNDENPDELWLVALFEDKESYFANADSPQQDREFQGWKKFMTAEPVWHDGKVIYHANGGGE